MPYPISYIIENASQFSAADMTSENLAIEDLTPEQLLDQIKGHMEYYIESIFYEKGSQTKLRRDITKDPEKLAQLTGDINKHKMAFFGLVDLLKKQIDLSAGNVSLLVERFGLVAKDNHSLSQMLNDRLANEADLLLLTRIRALEHFNAKLNNHIALLEQLCRTQIAFHAAYIKSLINPEVTQEPYNKIMEMLFLMGDYFKINEFNRNSAKCLLELSEQMHVQKQKIAEQEDTIKNLESSNKYFTSLFDCDPSSLFADLFNIKSPDELASSHISSSVPLSANITIPAEDSASKKRKLMTSRALEFDEEGLFNQDSLETVSSTLISSSSSSSSLSQFSNSDIYSNNVTTTTSSSSSSSNSTKRRLIRANSTSILSVRVNEPEKTYEGSINKLSQTRNNSNEPSVFNENPFLLSFLHGKPKDDAAWSGSVNLDSSSSSAPSAKRLRTTRLSNPW